MHLEGALADADAAHEIVGLGALPDWGRLPVLDLVGQVSSMETIQRRGDG